MSGRRADSAAPALLAFAGLLAFASLHWASLLADPPIWRALAAALVMVAGAAALALAGSRLRGPVAVAAWFALGLLTAALAGLAVGLPADLLAPGRWDQLGANLGDGLTRIGDADYPFAGRDEWARLVILLGLPLAGTLAALLAFRPGRARAEPAIAGLVVLVGAFGLAAAINPPAAPLLQGLVLFGLVAAWLWLPTVRRGSTLAAAALVALAGLAVLAPAARIDAADPWLDYSEWAWDRESDAESFVWDHSYGPIDWPRSGDVVLEVESKSPHYWRAAVLDRFDGYRWLGDEEGAGRPLDLPGQVEGKGSSSGSLDRAWTDRVGFNVVSLESRFLVGAGSVVGVSGIAGAEPSATGVILPERRPLRDGDAYSVLAYTPAPTDRRMRAASGAYPGSLRPYTEIAVPVGESLVRHLQVPLRGGGPGPGPPVGRILDASPYRGLYRLARRLSAGAPTTFDAVEAIAGHLRESYDYSEGPPRRRYPLRAFLFRDRIGYCQQFSGALALMLRTLGIPSRVATGFSPGTPIDGRFSVRDLDAHSWVEVYFRGIGWVTFDPTPAAAPASSRLARPGAPVTLDGSATRGGAHDVRTTGGALPPAAAGSGGLPAWLRPVAALFALALALSAAGVGLRGRRTRALAPAQLADAQARELRAALGRLRRPLPAGITLLALERRVGSARRDATAAYAAKLRAARYGRGFGPPGPSDRAAARRELSSGGGLARRLQGWRAFPPGGPSL